MVAEYFGSYSTSSTAAELLLLPRSIKLNGSYLAARRFFFTIACKGIMVGLCVFFIGRLLVTADVVVLAVQHFADEIMDDGCVDAGHELTISKRRWDQVRM